MRSKVFLHFFLFIPTIYISVIVSSTRADNNNQIRDLINQGFVANQKFSIQGKSNKEIEEKLILFYEARSFNPFWSDYKNLNPKFAKLEQAVYESRQDGLNPDDYSVPQILKYSNLAQIDIMLTLTTLKLASDARYGRYQLRKIDSQNFKYNQLQDLDLDLILKELASAEDISAFINSQFPRHRQYQRMKQALYEYREKQINYKLPVIKAAKPLKLGCTGEQVVSLSNVLKAYGDYQGVGTDTFDLEMQNAVKKFQKRHGISDTGEVHQKTYAALSKTIESRIKSLIINLERWRFLSREFAEGKEIFVNIAGYELFALQDGKVKHRLTTIVGKPFQATPVFSDMIEYIEFNPYWNVPTSIVVDELVAKQINNSEYLSQENIRIFSEKGSEIKASSLDFSKLSKSQVSKLRLRQDFGSNNVLGKLKFVFPNPLNIFLHDTSSPNLFSQSSRAFSHGCIRLKEPQVLAAFLLDTPEDSWDLERVQKVIESNKNINIKLPQKVPIHLTYRTAWVEADSEVNFREDIYSRDKLIVNQLADKL